MKTCVDTINTTLKNFNFDQLCVYRTGIWLFHLIFIYSNFVFHSCATLFCPLFPVIHLLHFQSCDNSILSFLLCACWRLYAVAFFFSTNIKHEMLPFSLRAKSAELWIMWKFIFDNVLHIFALGIIFHENLKRTS